MSNKQPNSGEDKLTKGQLKLCYVIVGFILWQLFVVAPFAIFFANEKDGIDTTLRAIIGLGGYGVFIHWLLLSPKGPGLDGFHRFLSKTIAPIRALPEPTRIKLVLPFFAASVVLILATIGWLTFSDEASQKRSLYQSWDRMTELQWFYNENSIDLFVYSETLDTLYRAHIPDQGDHPAAGVHIRYQGDLKKVTGSEFDQILRSDIKHARVGDLDKITGDPELGVYETGLTTFSFVAYHGAFGVTGHGVMEILMMITMLIFVMTFLITVRIRSYYLAGAAVLFSALGSMPSLTGNAQSDMQQPNQLQALTIEDRSN